MDDVPKKAPQTFNELGGQRNLRHQEQDLLTGGECLRNQMGVNLGLS